MLAMNLDKKIGLYLFDISREFDRVEAKLLKKKLARRIESIMVALVELYRWSTFGNA